ncbi:MAG: branched-chain amino acid ABC transporter permease [Rhodobacteraceae bacterium]|nr:branched-chain amino acid ABC transporter permease [Paracoccaceae bacterium]MDC0040139.1 branched-chain amino acid ABC transporter permease [Paracoccaceae bacterium]|tara:strand:- start:2450 stop:3748 length:1299 start_codon:yes stop_codon:yes gene_type:complete
MNYRNISLFSMVFLFLIIVGFYQSWNVAFGLLNLCLLSAIMALGVNIQWGYAGLFSIGTVGFVALGGVAAVVTSMPPVEEAWRTGGPGIITALIAAAVTIIASIQVWKRLPSGLLRNIVMIVVLLGGFFIFRGLLDPATAIIEKINPAGEGYLGGLGLPVIFSWLVGGLFAAGVAWVIGKISLGLRADYLAIATLGIAEIIIAIIKNEDWLTRGVKNVIGIPRPTAYEVDLQKSETFIQNVNWLGMEVVEASSLYVKLSYGFLFVIVLAIILWLSERALNSPWGRMMRAIRDNEEAAEAMGKDVTKRHLQVFILGSAVCGIAGAMMTSLDGLLTPQSYQPLRFTFLIWVMVIVGGSGNNWGAVLGGFLLWFFWIEVEPIGHWLLSILTSGIPDNLPIKEHLLDSAAHMRLITMGIILLVTLRFAPKGLIPEK